MHQLSTLKKDLLITLVLALVAFVLATATGWVALTKGPSAEEVQAEVNILTSRTVLSYTPSDDDNAIVEYSYVGGSVPEKLAPDEVVGKRTETSWTRLIDDGKNGGGKITAATIAYARPTFVPQDDGWHYVEYGTASQKAIHRYEMQVHPLSILLIAPAHAASFAPANDASILAQVTATSTTLIAFNSTQGTTTGSSITAPIFGIDYNGTVDNNLKGETLYIYRGFLPFDTSSIAGGATITSASLTVFGTTTGFFGTQMNDGKDYITVVETNEADYTTLVVADYNNNGSSVTNPTEGIATGDRKDISSGGFATSTGGNPATSGTNTFPLNATGLGWIKKAGQASSCSASTGVSCFGLREGHDTTRTTVTTGNFSAVSWMQAEATGTDNDPFLTVTYTVPFAFWQFQDY